MNDHITATLERDVAYASALRSFLTSPAITSFLTPLIESILETKLSSNPPRIDYDLLSACVASRIDLPALADEISLSNLSGEIYLNDLSNEIDLPSLADKINLPDLVNEINLPDLVLILNYERLARALLKSIANP